jgi:hypothetical protein
MTATSLLPIEVLPSLLPINKDAIPELVEQLTKTGPLKHRQLPLQFESPRYSPFLILFERERVNLLALQYLLDSIDLSIYSKDIEKLCDRSPSELILFGVIQMHISGVTLNAQFLEGLQCKQFVNENLVGAVSQMFSIPTHTDEPNPSHPAITISKPSVLLALAKEITELFKKVC